MNDLRTINSVCIVCDYFIPDNKAISIRMKYLADAFLNRGIHVSIITSSGSKNVKDYNITPVRFPVASNKDNVIIRLLKELLFGFEVFFKVFFSKYDLYLITSPPFTIAFFSVLACRLRNKNYIFDVRDEYPEVYFTEGLLKNNGIVGRGLINIEQWIYKKADLVTTVTNKIKSKLIKKIGNKPSVYLLRNGFADTIEFSQQFHSNKFVIMFHGNMGKFQEPELICKAAELCEHNKLAVEFRIYGWGNKATVIKEAGKKLSNMHHYGEIPHQEMTRHIKQAHIGLSFQGGSEISRNSFPSKVMEFIGSGVPVLITPVSEAGDFAEEHRVGFQFEPDQPEAIYEKIKWLVENPDAWTELKSNTAKIRGELTRSKVSTNFVEHYLKLR